MPCLWSLLLLSNIIQRPRASVKRIPVPPKAAVVIRAGKYFGASWLRKMLEATTPIRLATGTAILVSTTRLPSLAMLLLYQASRRTEGADVPLEE
jgi:hypothetical protein